MKLILLAGNHLSNKEWIEEVHINLNDLFDEAEILYYSHWDLENLQNTENISDINLDHEIEKLKKLVLDIDDYVIFAKSAGSLVALKAMHEGTINPKKVFIVGLPSNWAKGKGYDFEEWLKSLSQTIIFIQKTSDPQMSFDDLSKFIRQYENLNSDLKEVDGNTHHYENINELKKIIKDRL